MFFLNNKHTFHDNLDRLEIIFLEAGWPIRLRIHQLSQGGRILNFFSGRGVRPGFPKCGACELILASNKGACELKISKFGACELKISKFGACELKISKFVGLWG